jgi:hypothetical protein
VVHDAAEALTKVVLGALVVALAGCGTTSTSTSPLSWDKPPIVVRQPELPDDTIVSGEIKNGSGRTLHLDAREVRLLTADGSAVPQSATRFTTGVTHQLYPPREGPRENEPGFLRERLGESATVAPGQTTPLVVSWRAPAGAPQPVKVELGDEGSLSLP